MKIIFTFTLFVLIFLSVSVNAKTWHTERLRKVESIHKCQVAQGDRGAPFPFITTPNFHISWCKRDGDNKYQLIVLSSKSNPDWDECGEFIEVQEPYKNQILHIEQGASPYDKILPMYKFWKIRDSIELPFEFIDSEYLATNLAINFGFGSILYCYNKQWVITGSH